MARRTANRRFARRQGGAALIVFATVLILGVAWFTVGALGKAAPSAASREIRTGESLQTAKRALLAYVAQYAARSDTQEPGQLPCPESLSLANPGEASSSCSPTAIVVGRLPWKSLGIDQLRDGYGEPLWYMMRAFRDAPINFGSTGQLVHNGAAVVAMIIAPGVPLNTSADAGTPPAGCSKLDQFSATRNAGTLVPGNFLECGVASGSIASPANAAWSNDRAIAITAQEWADAIAPAVADRLQRQVTPAMMDFRNTTAPASWGENFLPNASAIAATETGSQPETNDLCGNSFPVAGDPRAGMPPTATVASATCSTNWATYSISGLGALLGGGTCAAWPAGTPTEIRCNFTLLLGGIASPRINITAPRIGYSFRYIDTSQISIQSNNFPALPPYPGASIGNFASSVSAASGDGTLSFEVFFPFLTLGSTVTIRIPYPADALLADARSAWFINNGWDRYTYYGVSPAATHDTDGSVCTPGGTVTGCLNVFGMPAPSNDKRLVLVLVGRARPGATQPSYTLTNYLEDQNASIGVNYDVKTVNSAFNDRVAACPYRYYAADGFTVLESPC